MSSKSARILSPDGGGPSTPPPTVPEGWLAQWESRSQRWYYVQRATGRSQWEVPTEPFIPTPTSTPQSVASPGPYHPPGTASDSEATRELREVRSGANWRSSGGSFSNIQYDNNQPSPQARQTNRQSQSPAMQTTPVAAGSRQGSRSSSQGVFGQTSSDVANRSASTEMPGVQQTTPQNPHGYPNPNQPTTTGADYANRSAQYSQDPQQYTGQGQGYYPQGDSMQLDDPRLAAQGQGVMYQGPDNAAPPANMPRSSTDAIPQSEAYFAPHQVPPVDPVTGSMPQGMPQGPLGPGASANPAAEYQQHGGPMPQMSQMPPDAPQDSRITVISPDPNRPLFPIPYQEAQQRRRERQENNPPPRHYQPGQPQPQRDSRYQPSSEQPPPGGYEPRAPQGYYDPNPQAYDPRYQHRPSHPGAGFDPTQGRYEPSQDPRYQYYEYRGGDYPPYNGQPSPNQHERYPMHRHPSEGGVPQRQYDYNQGHPPQGYQAGPPAGYAASHDQRHHSAGGYPGGRNR